MDRMDGLIRALGRECPGLELRENELLAGYTTFKIGGPARLMALPKNVEEARAAVQTARGLGVEPFFLGNGSNLLAADAGYDGFILKLGAFDAVESRGETGLRAGAAVPLARLAVGALDLGLTGLEFASGIPGTLGGAVTMNAGAYGGEMAQVITAVTYLDENGEGGTLSGEECRFGYRRSIFTEHPGWLILEAELGLTAGDREEIKARMEDLARQRRAKQPLDLPSAGSTFKRPAPVNGEQRYAAALIDGCGLKGLRAGGAQVSEKHAGFVVNTGGATCADVLALTGQIRDRVLAETGVELELEIKTLGVERV